MILQTHLFTLTQPAETKQKEDKAATILSTSDFWEMDLEFPDVWQPYPEVKNIPQSNWAGRKRVFASFFNGCSNNTRFHTSTQ